MPVFRLDPDDITFPPPWMAEPGGLLAIGGDLGPDRLITAYQNGIFPWFEEDGLFYWYSPDPRCVLFPSELKVHKSMRSLFNQHKFEYRADYDFEAVIRACASKKRHGQAGSWISEAFIRAYIDLHEAGIAHSMETWHEGRLVGGLYGLSIGKVFFGESMFSDMTNASKAAFITLVRGLTRHGFRLVDCQQETAHLTSLGARNIERDLFLEMLNANHYERTAIGKWKMGEEGLELPAHV